MNHLSRLLTKKILSAQCIPPSFRATWNITPSTHSAGRQCYASAPKLQESTHKIKDSPVASEQQHYMTFYRFPSITTARLISRMKIYQTGLTVVILPTIAIAQSFGHMQQASLMASTGVALFAGGMLFLMSHYFRRVIGAMGINEGHDTVRVSHLTFWGNRKDVFVPVEQIVPLSELSDRIMEPYIKFQLYDSKDYLYYSIRYGRIVDRSVFEGVMGMLH